MQNKQNRILTIRAQSHTHCSACLVRNLALFQGVPEHQLEWTQHHRENQYTINTGDILFHQGDITHNVYTVFDGWFVLYQLTNSGRRQIMRFALPGDFIGFQVNSQGKIGHSAQALTNGILCGFSRKKLSDMVKTNANISESLIVIISRDMSLCQQHFFGMTQKTAIESISFLLLELYHRVKNKCIINNNLPKDNSIYFPLTQEDIGDATGVSKIHTNRILRQLRDQKIVSCHKKRLTLLDEAALSEIAQFDINLIKNPKIL